MEIISAIKSREEWKELVAEYTLSGLSQTAFCKQKNISISKFGYYRSLFLPVEKPKPLESNSFISLQVKKGTFLYLK